MRAASQSPSQPIGRVAPFCVGHRLADLLFDKHNLLNRNGGFCYLYGISCTRAAWACAGVFPIQDRISAAALNRRD